MKIAICSDSHDNLVNIDKFLKYCKKEKVDVIFHCGDWCAPSVLRHCRQKFDGKMYGVFGNVRGDDKIVKKYCRDLDIAIKKDKLRITLDKIKFFITHFPQIAKNTASKNKYDIVFYGHTHKPWKEKVGETYLINPGTLAGMFYRASFATYDTITKKLELKILDQL